jgi:hypothetical protein
MPDKMPHLEIIIYAHIQHFLFWTLFNRCSCQVCTQTLIDRDAREVRESQQTVSLPSLLSSTPSINMLKSESLLRRPVRSVSVMLRCPQRPPMPVEPSPMAQTTPWTPNFSIFLLLSSIRVSPVLVYTVSCMVIRSRSCASYMALNRTVNVRTNERDKRMGRELRLNTTLALQPPHASPPRSYVLLVRLML